MRLLVYSFGPTVILIFPIPCCPLGSVQNLAAFTPTWASKSRIALPSLMSSGFALSSTQTHTPEHCTQPDKPGGGSIFIRKAEDNADEIWSPYRFASGLPTTESKETVKFGSGLTMYLCVRVTSSSACDFEKSRHLAASCSLMTSACNKRFAFSSAFGFLAGYGSFFVGISSLSIK